MKFGFKQLVLSTVFAGLAVPAALAQSPTNPFDRGRYTAVTERSQVDFDPQPVRAGSFNVWASLGLDASYNDNIFAESVGPDDDTVFHIRPNVEAQSDWSSHALTAGLQLDHREYVANDDESSTDYNAYANGRLDVQRSFALTGDVNVGHTTEERYEPGNTGTEPTQYETLGAGVGARYRSDRFQLEGAVSTTDRDFNAEANFRDMTENAVFARASYAISPDVAMFVQGRHSEQDYDQPGTLANPNRDGTRENIQVGVSFELQAPFRGEIAVGNVSDEKDDPIWADVDGLSVDGRLIWFPTQLTTITFRGNQGVTDPGLINVASAERMHYGVRVDHELRRNIIIFGDVGFTRYDYEGTPANPVNGSDEYADYKVGFAYKINRRMHAEFSYHLHNQNESIDPTRQSFDQNIISAGLKFYP